MSNFAVDILFADLTLVFCFFGGLFQKKKKNRTFNLNYFLYTEYIPR